MPKAGLLAPLASLLLTLAWGASPAAAQGSSEIIDAVVGVRAEVPSEARTADTLGQERLGSGIVIDEAGLVVTIGYLILEAQAVDLFGAEGRRVPAEIVGYDHESGFGLLRAREPLGVEAVELGQSSAVRVGDPLLVLSRAGRLGGLEAKLADRREFAGYWEYLLEGALFTTPPHAAFGGAALVDRGGRLVGVGSLFVRDAAGAEIESPGNMFVPIDTLKPIMAELLTTGRRDGPSRPWLGITVAEAGGHVVVGTVAADSPAAAAGIEPGDLLTGVGGTPVRRLPELWRTIWNMGAAGVRVPLQVQRGSRALEVTVSSADRQAWLRQGQTY